MGIALIKYKLMPEGMLENFEELKENISKIVEKYEGKVNQLIEEPIAFGLKAIILVVAMDESKETDKLEESLRNLKGISSMDTIDYRRAIE